MRQRGYAIAFALVPVALVAGAYFGGRFAIQRFRQDFQFRREWTPPELATRLPAAVGGEATSSPQAAAPTRRSAPTRIVVPTPVAPTPAPYAPPVTPVSAPAEATASAPTELPDTSLPSETPTPLPAPTPVEPFAPMASLRASVGDCGGTYVLGRVLDRNSEPISGVRLHLMDEFANEAFAVTKSGPSDMGRFDFPVAGPPRRFSLSVVDEAGATLSRTVGFAYYGDAADAQATCYWVDWQQR